GGPDLVQGDQPTEGAEAHDRGHCEPFLEHVGQGQRSRLGHLLRRPGLLTHSALPWILWPWELLPLIPRDDNLAFIAQVLLWRPRRASIIIFHFHCYLRSDKNISYLVLSIQQ